MSGRPLHLERRGKGPALMILHGYTGSAAGMRDLSQAFAGEYETIVPDLPGHGLSVGRAMHGRYEFEQCVRDLVATLESTGHQRAHWLGYSMGARLALACAARHPARVASLVLVGARAGIADVAARNARRREDELLASRIESGGVEAFVDDWMAMPLFASQQRFGAAFLGEQRRTRLANDAHELAAVSVRSTLGPSRTGLKPARCAASSSPSSNPPSGPTSSSTGFGAAPSIASDSLAAGLGTSRRPSRGESSRYRSRFSGARIRGNTLRPLCSQALMTTACQCRSLATAWRSSSRTTLRVENTGTMARTPSSVAFCNVRSILSPRETACTSVTASGDSRRTSDASPTRTCTRLP